jgi:Dynamin family
MSDTLQSKITEYQEWRSQLSKVITDYRDWLAVSPYSDSVRELRLYDVLETLKRDQIVMAFLAESSRGKTETINALFFTDSNPHFLPSDSSRASMCPVEILWDAREEPSIRLLSTATRASNDSLTYLKTTPKVWDKFKLNVDSHVELRETFLKLIEQKEVTQAEADAIGLYDPLDADMEHALATTGKIKIPAWRHAIINYPHPLLKNGLVVIDTPGLSALDAEPELTLNIISSAHAVLFVTGTDTGITEPDMQIWNDYIKGRAKYKLALLNKIDLLWDNLKPTQKMANEIEKRINITAHQLNIAPESVFAVSSQKALLGKIKKNTALVQQSGIVELETIFGNQIVQAKHEILGRTVIKECSEMVKSSRKLVQQHLTGLRQQVLELRAFKGLKADAAKQTLAKVITDKKRYEASILSFNQANEKISLHGKQFLRHLSLAYLDTTLTASRQEMGDSWTTVGLNQGMRNLMKQANELAEHITKESKTIKKLVENVYKIFQTKHGFDLFDPPELNMSKFLADMKALEKITDDFCSDPINVLTEKHFLIRKFFLGLGAQAHKIFEFAERDCERWLHDVLGTLKSQIAEHKAILDARAKNLMEARTSATALDAQLAILEHEYALIAKESQALDTMLLHLVKAMQPAVKAKTVKEKHDAELAKTLRMPDMPFLNTSSPAA